MDIEKICRTCLALSGPLLSIYDSAGSGSGCLADMLREFTKTKPQLNDMLPEKVCLTCISEINHCYSFKMKCENSNKTLRQLIPNALKETSPLDECLSLKVNICDMATQTERITYVSTTMQTITEFIPHVEHKEIQTDPQCMISGGKNESSASTNEINVNIYKDNKSNNTIVQRGVKRIRLEDNSNEEEGSYVLVATTTPERSTNINEENEESTLLNTVVANDNVSSSCHHFEYYDEENEIELNETETESENKETIDYVYAESVEDVPNMKDATEIQFITNDEECDHHYSNKMNCDEVEEDEEFLDETDLILKDPIAANNDSDNTVTVKINESKKKEYKCPQCYMTFVSLKYMRRHLSTRHDVEPSSAQMVIQKEVKEVITNNVVEQGAKISRHQHQQQQSMPLLTEGSVPVPRLQLRQPTSSPATPPVGHDNTSKLRYFCEYCKAGFVWRKTLTLHMKQNICKSDNFKCDICERIFITKKNLEAHIDTHNNQHTCLECKQVCANIEDLSQHMIKAHNRKARNQCNVCKKVFTMKTSLMDHMRIHSGEKPFLCTVCGKSFRQNSNLRQHVMRHTNEKNFKCDICTNAYVTKAELFSHKRTHTGDHPFKCDMCSARFTSSSSLQKHRRKHTGERPYACEFCPMRFTALNILKNHRRTHTGEKPYQCEFCEKRFSQKGDCQMHQRTHNAKNIICSTCGAKFTKPSNLRQHEQTHHSQVFNKQEEQEERQEIDEETSIQITVMEDGDGNMDEINQEHENDAFMDESTIKATDSALSQERLTLSCNDDAKRHTDEEIMKMACLLI